VDPLVEIDPTVPIDWTFLMGINLFQVAVVCVFLWVICRLLMRFWPWLRKVMNFTNALAKLPDFIVRVDDTLQKQDKKIDEIHTSLTGQDAKIAEIHHETSYNNETSMKDALRRVEMGVKGLYDQLDISGYPKK